jgi:hypothetical protein
MSRIFVIKGSIFKYHFDVVAVDDDASHSVHIRRRAVTGNTPLLTMHDGSDETAPVMAVSHLPHFSKNFKIGLGDPGGPSEAMRWEDMLTAKSGVKHKWAVDLVAPQETPGDLGGKEERRAFLWTRTKHVTVDGMHKPTFKAQNYKLTEEDGVAEAEAGCVEGKDGKQIVAVFTSSMARGEIGKIQLNVDYGRDFDVMVWMTCFTIYWAGR